MRMREGQKCGRNKNLAAGAPEELSFLENPGEVLGLSPRVIPMTAAGLQGEQPLADRTM